MNKVLYTILCAVAILFTTQKDSIAHCQVPCGIFEDDLRFHALEEEVTTIRKAMVNIKKNQSENKMESINQSVRWIITKEEHANNMIKTMCDYFLAQRVKADQNGYVQMLKNIHSIILFAVKSKQTLEEENCDKLLAEIKNFQKNYQERDKKEQK